jgi:hypothetical protein
LSRGCRKKIARDAIDQKDTRERLQMLFVGKGQASYLTDGPADSLAQRHAVLGVADQLAIIVWEL